MSIRAEAEQHDVEQGTLIGKALGAIERLQHTFVGEGTFLRACHHRHRMDVFRRHRHVFEAIERPRRLLLATTETRLDGSALAFSTEFTFEPRDGATLMTMIQWGFPSDELREEHGRGLPHAFDRLERAL